jgi:Glycosyl transferase family 2
VSLWHRSGETSNILLWKKLSLAAYHFILRFRTANRLRRRGPGYTGLFSEQYDRKQRPLQLGVMAIVKNESHLIEEWLEHYFEQGADRIYLIDNGSTDDTVAKIEPFCSDGKVSLVVYPEQHQQRKHYWNAFLEFGIAAQCEWLLIADIDEFWFCKSGEDLASYVTRQSLVDAIYVNWSNFGTRYDVQPASVRSELTFREPRLSRFTKYMFRTCVPQYEKDIDIHFIRNVGLSRAKIANQELQLNHYLTQSRHFWFNVKLRRGDVYFNTPDMEAKARQFDQVNQASTESCLLLREQVSKRKSTR